VQEGTVSFVYPTGHELSSVSPTITVSPKATISPASGIAQNFADGRTVTYIVTAEDGTRRDYIARASRVGDATGPEKSSQRDVITFKDGDIVWTINGLMITALYPFGSDITKISPEIEISDKAVIHPLSGVERNFSNYVTYTVTAENGLTRDYQAIATMAAHTPVTSVSIPETASVSIGETLKLNMILLPVDASIKTVTWLSSNPTIARANPDGTVTALSEGTAYITVTSNDDQTKTATCTVTVIDKSKGACDITSFTYGGISWNIDQSSRQITAVYPHETDLSNINPTIEISDGAIVSPDAAQDFSSGKWVIYTVTAANGTKKEYRARATTNYVAVTGVTINRRPQIEVVVGSDDLKLTATVFPTNATNKAVTWSSSDREVVSVNADGLITAISEGEAEITVTTNEKDGGLSATITVTVVDDGNGNGNGDGNGNGNGYDE